MDNTKLDFEKRKAEIENYVSFLQVFDRDETRITYVQDNNPITERIQPQFQITLIANAFLILYNLIESTVRNSIINIYDCIKDDDLPFEKLSENLKRLWIKQSTDGLKENNFRPETLREYVLGLTEDILNKETIIFSNEWMEFSGNLDARKIRDLATKIGFQSPPNGRDLLEIKNKRNRLAHGEQTFYDVGKDFTVNQIIEFKTTTFSYLEEVIQNIETFIVAREYAILET
jgi:hypothetical protein